MDYTLASKTTFHIFIWMVLNGLMYHYQTMTAWVLMEYVSPVTHRWVESSYRRRSVPSFEAIRLVCLKPFEQGA